MAVDINYKVGWLYTLTSLQPSTSTPNHSVGDLSGDGPDSTQLGLWTNIARPCFLRDTKLASVKNGITSISWYSVCLEEADYADPHWVRLRCFNIQMQYYGHTLPASTICGLAWFLSLLLPGQKAGIPKHTGMRNSKNNVFTVGLFVFCF